MQNYKSYTARPEILEGGNKSPALFSKTGDLLPARKIFIERPRKVFNNFKCYWVKKQNGKICYLKDLIANKFMILSILIDHAKISAVMAGNDPL